MVTEMWLRFGRAEFELTDNQTTKQPNIILDPMNSGTVLSLLHDD